MNSCWRKEGDGDKQPKQPKQPRQHEPPTYGTIGTLAATHNLTPTGSSKDWTTAGRIGIINSSDHRHPRQHHPHLPLPLESCQCGHRGPTTSKQSDKDDDDDDEVAKIEAVRARRVAAKARYRARHPDRIAEQKRRYRKRYRAKRLEALKLYYNTHAERLWVYQRQRRRSEAGKRWDAQFRARVRESLALLGRQRGSMIRKRTEEKRQALGPLKLTVTLEDFMQDFHDSLTSTPEEEEEDKDPPCARTITDMDSGELHPMDHAVCDMWDGGKGFLDNLLEELGDLPSSSSSDDSFCDLSFEEWIESLTDSSSSFDLDDFVT